MRVALIGDVHANLPALEAVLEHAHRHRVDEVWGVGDWVGIGAFPDEVVQLLQQHGVKAVIGNYDLSVLKVQAKRVKWGQDGPPENWQPAAWAYDRLSEKSREYLRSLPPEIRLEVQGRRILLTHIGPSSPDEYIGPAPPTPPRARGAVAGTRDGVPDTPNERLREWAQTVAADVVIVGHTHAALARKVGGVWFINTGSVGRPKDGAARACYAILTLGEKRVQVRHYRVDYDMDKAQAPVEPARTEESRTASALPILPTLPRTQGGVPGTRDGVPETPGAVPVSPILPRTQDGVPEARGGVPTPPKARGGVPTAPPAAAAPAAAPSVPDATKDDRLQAVLQLARSCEYEEGHTHQVTRLALQLFDELQLVHGLGPRERYWLQCGALLHDIGLIEGVQGHHKASLRIILDTPLLPFDKRERLMIGSIARYHRAALPQERHSHFAALKPGSRRIVRILAAILRVADGLDYTHQSLVNELSCVLSPKQILVRCAVKGPAEEERQRALQKGDLLEEVLERKLVIECQGP
jgi:predicted phosphodiesterase